MFKDMKMSNDINSEFNQLALAKSLPLDLNIKVLTAGHWPNDGKKEPALSGIPREIESGMNAFSQFYYQKFNNGRQLTWKMSLGTAELKGNIFDKKYEFVTSTYQMYMLTLFNSNEKLSY